MATYLAMALEVDGELSHVWQKVEVTTTVLVTGQTVSYVDAKGNPVTLPETYEMAVLGEASHPVPGVI